MTNREWLNSLTDDDLITNFGFTSLCEHIPKNICNRPYCRMCLQDWLAAEHIDTKEDEEDDGLPF